MLYQFKTVSRPTLLSFQATPPDISESLTSSWPTWGFQLTQPPPIDTTTRYSTAIVRPGITHYRISCIASTSVDAPDPWSCPAESGWSRERHQPPRAQVPKTVHRPSASPGTTQMGRSSASSDAWIGDGGASLTNVVGPCSVVVVLETWAIARIVTSGTRRALTGAMAPSLSASHPPSFSR